MSDADCRWQDRIAALPSVGLADLAPVSLLTRYDRKYLVGVDQLVGVIDAIGPECAALEVSDRRSTPYSSVYFDTPDLASYRAHVQGRRRRFKVRTRHYGDPSSVMLEVKLKGARGFTVKCRRPHSGLHADALDPESIAYVKSMVEAVYGFEPAVDLAPSLVTTYERTTLVDLAAGLRVTVDRSFRVRTGSDIAATSLGLGEGLAIVETKSAVRRPPVERQLVMAGARPQPLSKYCIGVAALLPEVSGNRWRPQLRRLLVDNAPA